MAEGLAAAERAALTAWWDSDWPRDGRDVLDALAETVEGIIAARVERSDGLTVAEAWDEGYQQGWDNALEEAAKVTREALDDAARSADEGFLALRTTPGVVRA